MKKILLASTAALLLTIALPAISHADDSAGQQLNDADYSGNAATHATSDEDAKSNSNEVFDTAAPSPPPVDTTSPSEGSSGLSNAPTYNENSGSGLNNAPTP